MIRRDHCIQLFLDIMPECTEAWQTHLEHHAGTARALRHDIAQLGRFLANHIVSLPEQTVRKIFRVAETCLEYGDAMVKRAIAGRFFDALIDGTSAANEFIAEAIVPFLGNHSLAFSKAWDNLPTPRTAGVS